MTSLSITGSQYNGVAAAIVRAVGAITLVAIAAMIAYSSPGSQQIALASSVKPPAPPAASPSPATLPGANPANAAAWLPYINNAMNSAGIDTPRRAAAFLAELGEETAGFDTLTEYGSGKDYNDRKDLGNTQAGDGPKYKGRGGLQLTGRNNYAKASKALGVDFVDQPSLVADPRYAFTTAAWYWTSRNLNAAADKADPQNAASFDKISQIINGGTHGQDVRRNNYVRICQALHC